MILGVHYFRERGAQVVCHELPDGMGEKKTMICFKEKGK